MPSTTPAGKGAFAQPGRRGVKERLSDAAGAGCEHQPRSIERVTTDRFRRGDGPLASPCGAARRRTPQSRRLEEQIDVVLGGEKRVYVAIKHEVGLDGSLDGLGDLEVGGVN